MYKYIFISRLSENMLHKITVKKKKITLWNTIRAEYDIQYLHQSQTYEEYLLVCNVEQKLR